MGDEAVTEATEQARFTGWAIVEMMGHRVEIGFVTTEAYGQAVLFRVDTPELPEREYTLTQPETARVDGMRQWVPAGTKVKRLGTPSRSCLIAPSSLYAINPCSEEAARTRMERSIERPLIAIEIPKGEPAQIKAGDDRAFACCGGTPEDGHASHCTEADDDDYESDPDE